jgi:hypothetical protein
MNRPLSRLILFLSQILKYLTENSKKVLGIKSILKKKNLPYDSTQEKKRETKHLALAYALCKVSWPCAHALAFPKPLAFHLSYDRI